ncbi:uncharacterized protein [Miscanthus floridulus]|uniref:uncharacterized protein n=1 Tax=Miscanthus floridulus TaxID=154761 RepID=UPI003459F5F5
MAKRQRSEERGCRSTAKRPAPERKKHLYLLLDDWERGYSVRRLDVDDFDSDADTGLPPTRFTEPPAPGEASPGIPAFDTRTLALSVCSWPYPGCSRDDYMLPLFDSAAGKLFAFTDVDAFYLGDQPPYGSKAPWSWTAVEPRPPFYASQVKCYALHPDGRTLFVSAASRRSHRSGSFSLDAERLEWTRRGDWLLPFAGQSYFDAELEAWVGLCRERDNAGRLCSCDVVAPVAAGELATPPSWKIGEDTLFREDYSEQLRLGAKLVYMGGHSKFCLVELLFHKDDEHLDSENKVWPPRPRPRRRRVLNLTTFGVKYNKEGQLRTSMLQATLRFWGIIESYGILALSFQNNEHSVWPDQTMNSVQLGGEASRAVAETRRWEQKAKESEAEFAQAAEASSAVQTVLNTEIEEHKALKQAALSACEALEVEGVHDGYVLPDDDEEANAAVAKLMEATEGPGTMLAMLFEEEVVPPLPSAGAEGPEP